MKNTPIQPEVIARTKEGKLIYKNHSFMMFSLFSWSTYKVIAIDKEGVHTTGHTSPVPFDEFMELIDKGEDVKKNGKDHEYHRMGYLLSKHGEERGQKDNRRKLAKK